MAESTLTQNYLKFILDYKDGNLYWKQRLARCVQVGDKAGNLKPDGYVVVCINKFNYSNRTCSRCR